MLSGQPRTLRVTAPNDAANHDIWSKHNKKREMYGVFFSNRNGFAYEDSDGNGIVTGGS